MGRQRLVAQLDDDTAMEYVDTGGDGPPMVLLHGALMDDGLWHEVLAALPDDLRCVVPVLPLGAHRLPMPDHVDVSPAGLARLVVRLLDHLGLRSPVLVGNDTGGAIAQLLVAEHPERAGALALVSCDAYDNFPPGLPGRVMALACRVPGGLRTAMASLRFRPMRRLPLTYGWMTRRPIDPQLFRRWLDAFAADPGVRRDVRRFMAGVDRHQLGAAAQVLATWDRPALVAWAADDKVMPRAHAERLVAELPDARLHLVHDSYTLVPLDQPTRLADLMAAFARELREGRVS